MYARVSPDNIQLPPGAVVRLPATWQDYQTLCQQRGDDSMPRLKYSSSAIELEHSGANYSRFSDPKG